MSSDSPSNAPATSSGCAAGVIILSVLCQKESRSQVINFPFLRVRSEVFRELLDMNNTNGFPPGVLLNGFSHMSSHRLVKPHVWSCLKMSIATPIPPPPHHPDSQPLKHPSIRLHWPSGDGWGETPHLRLYSYFHVDFLKWLCQCSSFGTEVFAPCPPGIDGVSQTHGWLSIIWFLFVSKIDKVVTWTLKWPHASSLFIIAHRCCLIISSLFDSLPITYSLSGN